MTDTNEKRVVPTHLYVVSDSGGFVGAFTTKAAAVDVARSHDYAAFIVQRFKVAPGPLESVWVVPYRDATAVAFVSNSQSEAGRVHKMYAEVGLTFPDSIEYWEQPLNVVSVPAAARLDLARRARMASASAEELRQSEEADIDRLTSMDGPIPNGPLEQIIRESEPITIMNCVVPVRLADISELDDEAKSNSEKNPDDFGV